MKPTSFEEACLQALESNVPLVLSEDVQIAETICLRKNQELVIKCGDDRVSSRRCRISGDVHSLFLLNNKSKLILENVDLHHTLQTDNHKQVGAAVQLRYKGSMEAAKCTITSTSGFSVWGVQKSRIQLNHCRLEAPARSAVVCFGQVHCQIQSSSIDQSGVHGLCARGGCQIEVSKSRISGSAARALYAYAGARVDLRDCEITHTFHPQKAAIEVSAVESSGTSSLYMEGCHVTDNCGVGLRVVGSVEFDLGKGTIIERNAAGNVVVQEENLEPTISTESNTPQRDLTASSFKQGDWWCARCDRILVGNHDQCSSCGSDKKDHGRLLTAEEIGQCNRGIAVRDVLGVGAGTIIKDENIEVTWYFDGDDKGWIAYDRCSSIHLEETYQKAMDTTSSPIVTLSGGRYQVNVRTMEQINTVSQFLRLVRREAGRNASQIRHRKSNEI